MLRVEIDTVYRHAPRRDHRLDDLARARARARRATRPARRQLPQRLADVAGGRRADHARVEAASGRRIPSAGRYVDLRPLGDDRGAALGRRRSARAAPRRRSAAAHRDVGRARVLRGVRRGPRTAAARGGGDGATRTRARSIRAGRSRGGRRRVGAGQRRGVDRRAAARAARSARSNITTGPLLLRQARPGRVAGLVVPGGELFAVDRGTRCRASGARRRAAAGARRAKKPTADVSSGWPFSSPPIIRQWNTIEYIGTRAKPRRRPSSTAIRRTGSHSIPVSSSTSFIAISDAE